VRKLSSPHTVPELDQAAASPSMPCLARKVALAVTCAASLLVHHAHSATLYWDGTGTSWSTVSAWSTAPNGPLPNPPAVPGANDIAAFSVGTVSSNQTVNLNGTHSVLGLVTVDVHRIVLRGGTADSTLNIGASGIDQASGSLLIGETSSGQQVAISTHGTQSWISTGTGSGIVVNGGVSIGSGGDQKLSLGGSHSGSWIGGTISDGAAILSLGKGGSGMWRLTGANTYTGPVSISGGILRIENSLALGSPVAGTSITGTASLELEGNITVTGETLTLSGSGLSNGTLVNSSGFNTWTGDITIHRDLINPFPLTSVNSKAGRLAITGNIRLSPLSSDRFLLQGVADGEISGIISGSSQVVRSGGWAVWTLSGANTYTGKTSILQGTIEASSLNRVAGGIASSSLGAPTTIANGTIDLGSDTTIGTLRYTGAGETTDRMIQLAGATGALAADGGTIDQSGTGILEFTSDFIVSGAKSLQLRGSTTGEGKISGAIGGDVSVTKSGSGTWTLSGANTYSRGTSIAGGMLIADLSTNPGGVLGSPASLGISNGIFKLIGASSGSSEQSLSGLSRATGLNRIIIDPNGGTGTVLTIGSPALSSLSDSPLRFDYTAGTTNGSAVGNSFVAWNPNLTNGIVGTDFTVIDQGGAGYATVSEGKIVRLIPAMGLPASGASSTFNYLLNGNTSPDTPGSLNLVQQAGQTINTLTVDTAATSGILTVAGTVLSTKGILVTGSTGNSFTIAASAGGGIRSPEPEGYVRLEQQSSGPLIINAPILANGISSFAKSGPGLAILNGANTYTGRTILFDGTTRFAGAMGASIVEVVDDAIAQLGSSTGLTSSNRVYFYPTSFGRLQLNGFRATIGGVSSVSEGAVVENASPTPATLTISTADNIEWRGTLRDGAGGGALSVILAPSKTTTFWNLNGGIHTGLTTIHGPGVVTLTGSSGGNLLISSGGRLRFSRSDNQLPDTATLTIEGAGSVFNGTALNNNPTPLNDTFANLHMTGGAFTTGAGMAGITLTGETTIEGGTGNTIFYGSGGSRYTTNRLSLTNMTGVPGNVQATPNSFAIYGNDLNIRSSLVVGSGGLHLNSSILNLKTGSSTEAKGSRLVLDGDVTTTGTANSQINLDNGAGIRGPVSVDLSSTSGNVERTFDIEGNANLSINVPIGNGEATTASITKAGSGRLTLSATNTYNGVTNVKAGTLVVSGIASGGPVIVGDSANPQTAAILMGDNSRFSDITVLTPGASVNPGLGPLTPGLLRTSTFSLTNSARLSIQIGDVVPGGNAPNGYDRLSVLSPAASANVSGGVLELTDTSLAPLPAGALLFIVVHTGTGAPSSLFGSVTLGGLPVTNVNNIVIGGQPFELVNDANFDGVTGSYGGTATGGNDIALVAVPEPLSSASFLVSVALVGLRRPRRP
jgi:autotransporter-associated beta strand protein